LGAALTLLTGYTQIAYSKAVEAVPMTVVETERFLKDAKPLMSDLEREEFVRLWA